MLYKCWKLQFWEPSLSGVVKNVLLLNFLRATKDKPFGITVCARPATSCSASFPVPLYTTLFLGEKCDAQKMRQTLLDWVRSGAPLPVTALTTVKTDSNKTLPFNPWKTLNISKGLKWCKGTQERIKQDALKEIPISIGIWKLRNCSYQKESFVNHFVGLIVKGWLASVRP